MQKSEPPVIGDGVITIQLPVSPPEKESQVMNPDQIAALMMTESAGNIQASNRNSRNTYDIAMGALQGTIVSNFKDIGVLEGRSASGVFATPIAGPANAAK
jgi:hypothetical protein